MPNYGAGSAVLRAAVGERELNAEEIE